MPQRSSDVIESHSERALSYGLGGLAAIAIATVLYIFRGEGWLNGLTAVLFIAGVAAVGYAAYCGFQIRKVTGENVECPYCKFKNRLTEAPMEDFSCRNCYRMVPVQDGRILSVSQVRCGYCNELNYFSEKTEVLICESCNREIPISVEEGRARRHVHFVREDDDKLYELVLVAHGHKTEELIGTLQHMLALNRNQVKQMLDELPVTLLTGITRKKAELLQAQLAASDAAAEFHPVSTVQS